MIQLQSSLRQAVDKFPFVSKEPLDLGLIMTQMHHPGAGAIVLFSGETRDQSRGKEVAYLDYEAHEAIASKMIEDILKEAAEKWELKLVFAQHRVGRVDIMEPAVVVVTASAHRSEAYKANKFIIDKIKHEVPIWKNEFFSDGTNQWGGNCNCAEKTGDHNKHIYED
jgi:molybdopterin synthase catalytic subunit